MVVLAVSEFGGSGDKGPRNHRNALRCLPSNLQGPSLSESHITPDAIIWQLAVLNSEVCFGLSRPVTVRSETLLTLSQKV